MEIEWFSVANNKPELNEKVLTCDVVHPDDGFCWEERIGGNDWSESYSVTHWARLKIEEIKSAL